MRFTCTKAILTCRRKLHYKQEPHTCYNCYYHDGRCELGFNCNGVCEYYVNDVLFTNTVRRNILTDPVWVEYNWERLCQVDKELFIVIYDKKKS